MTVLVIGSVIGYSVILPQQAPKQITLAVLPFKEKDERTVRALGFTAVLRDALALSRDVVVVDMMSTYSVAKDERSPGELVSMLALTHFVDGRFEITDDGAIEADYRVINVTQPNWKEVKKASIQVAPDSERPWQFLRDELTREIRESLYDNNSMRVESNSYGNDDFEKHLEVVGSFVARLNPKDKTDSWIVKYSDFRVERMQTTAIRSDLSSQLASIQEALRNSGDFERYSQSLWQITGDYPNSEALLGLADVAYQLGHFRSAELLWLRVARLRPQSAQVALKIANARWRLGRIDEAKKALSIAFTRSNDSKLVGFYSDAFHELIRGQVGKDESHEEEPISRKDSLSDAEIDTIFEEISGIDDAFEFLIHVDGLGAAVFLGVIPKMVWEQPPMFMRASDPRWLKAKELFDEIRNHESIAELQRDSLPQLADPATVMELFTPRRPD